MFFSFSLLLYLCIFCEVLPWIRDFLDRPLNMLVYLFQHWPMHPVNRPVWEMQAVAIVQRFVLTKPARSPFLFVSFSRVFLNTTVGACVSSGSFFLMLFFGPKRKCQEQAAHHKRKSYHSCARSLSRILLLSASVLLLCRFGALLGQLAMLLATLVDLVHLHPRRYYYCTTALPAVPYLWYLYHNLKKIKYMNERSLGKRFLKYISDSRIIIE